MLPGQRDIPSGPGEGGLDEVWWELAMLAGLLAQQVQ